ncbi:MAG TPA: VOC family protein [Actinomycetes bacterium]|jgi:catechol 2,3-dioxygenase-like lactoylglutathione lyase family enzyme|nr:VOC family protein [Actinomycetes bacterium]
MQVRNIRWVGTATSNYSAMAAFARDVLGMRVNFEEEATTELLTLGGDAFQVFGPGDTYHDFFDCQARGPVPLFEVDDVHEAREELVRAGIEVIGDLAHDSNWDWVNFRAPDGHLYELASRRPSKT